MCCTSLRRLCRDMYHFLSGASACMGSAWPAYTGFAEISLSIWGIGLYMFCIAGLHRMCRDIISGLGHRPVHVLHSRPNRMCRDIIVYLGHQTVHVLHSRPNRMCIDRPPSGTPGFAGQCTCPINRLCSTIWLKGVYESARETEDLERETVEERHRWRFNNPAEGAAEHVGSCCLAALSSRQCSTLKGFCTRLRAQRKENMLITTGDSYW
jgi:hypothetical protein